MKYKINITKPIKGLDDTQGNESEIPVGENYLVYNNTRDVNGYEEHMFRIDNTPISIQTIRSLRGYGTIEYKDKSLKYKLQDLVRENQENKRKV